MSSTATPLVDVTDIIRLVGNTAFNRAAVYARNGAVLKVNWNSDTSRLTGTVQGTDFEPYLCKVNLTSGTKNYSRPTSSTCTCPIGGACKHVAATLLASNAARVKQLNAGSAASARTSDEAWADNAPSIEDTWLERQMREADEWAGIEHRPLRPEPKEPAGPPQPAWKTAVAALTGDGTASAPLTHTMMGLQFELREQTPRSKHRWNGPTAKKATSTSGLSEYRLGVRPVIRNGKGNWVRTNVGWNTFSYQVNRLGLHPDQHRWFGQFSALHRATREVYVGGQELDWLYLDDFHSPLLWTLLAEGRRLGIELLGSKKDATVTIGSEASVTLDARTDSDDLRLETTLVIDGVEHPAADAGSIGTHGVYSYVLEPAPSFTLAPTKTPLTTEQRRLIGQPSTVRVPAEDVGEFLTEYYPKLRRSIAITSSNESVAFPEVLPPTLVLTASFGAKHSLTLDWGWEYAEGSSVRRMPLAASPSDANLRDTEAELALAATATRILRPAPLAPVALQGLDAAEFTDKVLPEIEATDGIRVDVIGERPDYRELTETPKLKVTTVETDQRDWFDLGVVITIDGKNIPFGPLFKALSKGQKKLLLVDNSYLSLEQPEFAQLHELIEEARALAEWDTGLRISRYQSSLWDDLEDLADESEQAASWQASLTGLRELTSVEQTPLPAGLDATLRPYQHDGFNWLAFLWKHSLGGVLADDMGLGKTLQALALIAHAKQTAAPGQHRPFLVVAPTSVVSNWHAEAQRFAPDLKVATITATRAKHRRAVPFGNVDIVLTSYTLMRLDFEAYSDHEWAGLIFDEAQFLKNRTSRVHQAARDLRAPFKLAITGTPMENNLLELWSLFAIVAPGLFPSAKKFTDSYAKPIESGSNDELLPRLRRRIRPLMMRRTKELVASDLPAKQEQVLAIDLNPKHRKLYDTFLQRERQKLLGLLGDMDKNRFIVFRSLTLLRMLSLDASLVDEQYANVPSSKLDALFEQLEDVVAEGHRSLIFSQFTSFLQKAAARLDAQGIPYAYLDGSTTKRADVIARFKNGEAPVFLISLKAGGFGLNLTEADYVFLLDPWWNPASEAQAVDRTHRIGQTKNVMVYRMVANGTIEEKVMKLKEQKAKLFSSVMDDDAVFSSALTADDIRGLLEEPEDPPTALERAAEEFAIADAERRSRWVAVE
ncbi:SNF2-related protein [Mycetocola zhadangensis]|uniref:DEAD/DEAH box helicase n=1 Tax=Mycetocola zhadangensis TaxID=1164595 RepID=UPI003A4D7CD5